MIVECFHICKDIKCLVDRATQIQWEECILVKRVRRLRWISVCYHCKCPKNKYRKQIFRDYSIDVGLIELAVFTIIVIIKAAETWLAGRNRFSYQVLVHEDEHIYKAYKHL